MPAPGPALAAVQPHASTIDPGVDALPPRDGRPSIAVVPFQLLAERGPHDIVADALPADIITDLARLPWLFVIAVGSSFRQRGRDCVPRRAGRERDVRYCLTGPVELSGRTVTILTALVDAGDRGTIWADQFRGALDDLQQLRPEIAAHVVANLEVRIQQREARRARGRPPPISTPGPASTSASTICSLYPRRQCPGQHCCSRSRSKRDPRFARAPGGLSFMPFHNAFLRFASDRAARAGARGAGGGRTGT